MVLTTGLLQPEDEQPKPAAGTESKRPETVSTPETPKKNPQAEAKDERVRETFDSIGIPSGSKRFKAIAKGRRKKRA